MLNLGIDDTVLQRLFMSPINDALYLILKIQVITMISIDDYTFAVVDYAAFENLFYH